MLHFTKFAVLKYSTGIIINRMFSCKTSIFPIRIATKSFGAQLSSLQSNNPHLQNSVFCRCMSSKKDDSKPPLINNNGNINSTEQKDPIQRRIYKRPKKYKFMEYDIKKPFVQIDIHSTREDKTVADGKVISPDLHHQENIPIENEGIKDSIEASKEETANQIKKNSFLNLKKEDYSNHDISEPTLIVTEKIKSVIDSNNELGIPTEVKKHTAVHIEYVEKTGKDMSSESNLRDVGKRTGSEYKSGAAAISAMNRAISSAMKNDLLRTNASNNEDGLEKLFGKSNYKIERSRKNRNYWKKLRRPVLNEEYRSYLDEEKDDQNAAIKHRRLPRNLYAMNSNSTNFIQYNRLRNRRKRLKKSFKPKSSVTITSFDDNLASTSDPIKKSFHVAAAKNADFKKPNKVSDGQQSTEQITSKEPIQDDGNDGKPPNKGFIENSKKYVRTLFYSLFSLAGAIILILMADWMSEQQENLPTPLEAINSYLTTLPTEETAFGNEDNKDSILTAEKMFNEESDSEIGQDEQ